MESKKEKIIRRKAEKREQKEDKSRRDNQVKTWTRRGVLGVFATLAGGVVIAGIRRALGPDTKHSQSTPVIHERQVDDIEETEKIIRDAESGLRLFESVLNPKIAALPPGWLRDQVGVPFKNFNVNLANENRNGPKWEAHMRVQNITEFQPANSSYFYYWNNSDYEEREGTVAAFDPINRIMRLSKTISAENLLDMSLFYHELVHVNLTTKMSDKHREFYTHQEGRGKRLLLTHEAVAWALQLETIDMLLDGDLSAGVKHNLPLTVEAIVSRLRAKPKQAELVRQILGLANIYFKKPFDDKNLSPEFLRAITRIYGTGGMEMYVETAKGEFVRY